MANDLGPTDDGSTAAVPLGFEVTYFGANYTSVYINNNGYIAFDEEVSTLFTATKLDQRLFAVFFADVDTRPDAGTGTMHYGTDTVDGRPAFGATWPAVGYYERHVDHLDTFQAIIIDRTDTGAGHFDVEFNFGTISWECGDRSDGGVDGIGGRPSAIVGYSDGVNPSFLAGSSMARVRAGSSADTCTNFVKIPSPPPPPRATLACPSPPSTKRPRAPQARQAS
jgi:hypothetical protein